MFGSAHVVAGSLCQRQSALRSDNGCKLRHSEVIIASTKRIQIKKLSKLKKMSQLSLDMRTSQTSEKYFVHL